MLLAHEALLCNGGSSRVSNCISAASQTRSVSQFCYAPPSPLRCAFKRFRTGGGGGIENGDEILTANTLLLQEEETGSLIQNNDELRLGGCAHGKVDRGVVRFPLCKMILL